MRSKFFSLSLLITAALLIGRAEVHAASISEEDDNGDEVQSESLENCIRETADFVSQVEIDDDVRSLVEQIRQYQNQDGPDEYVIFAYPDGCNTIRERVENSRSEVACNEEFQMDEHKILENSRGVLRDNHAARDVLEAHLACQVADGAANLINQYNSMMNQYVSDGDEDQDENQDEQHDESGGGQQVDEHVAEDSDNDEDENGHDSNDDNSEDHHHENNQDDNSDGHEDNNDEGSESQDQDPSDEHDHDDGEHSDDGDGHDQDSDESDNEGDHYDGDGHDENHHEDQDVQHDNQEEHHDGKEQHSDD